MSKTVTAVMAADLAESKRIDLDAPLSGFSPTSFVSRCSGRTLEDARGTFPCVDGWATIPLTAEQRGVTPRRLGGHLAGIAHYGNGQGTPNPPEDFLSDYRRNTGIESALPFLTAKPLVGIPGERFAYTTFGFNLLGVTLEKASGQPFASLVEKVNGKALTHIAVDREVAPAPHRAVGYLMKDGRIQRNGSTDIAWKAPGGGLISTVDDFTRYCAALDGNALLSNQSKSLLWTSQKDGAGKDTQYGFGFAVDIVQGERHVAHDGAQEKVRTSLSYFPERHLCVVVMTNAEYAEMDSIAPALDRAALSAAK